MPYFSSIIKFTIALLAGILFGLFLLFSLAWLPLGFDNKIYQVLGIRKPQVIGFLPFWLLERADKDYEKYINILTYFSLTLESDGTILKLVNPQEEEPGWTTLKSSRLQERLKKKENLKLSLLLHNSNEEEINALISKPQEHAQNLINDILPLMEKYNFTNLNLDIESFKKASSSAQTQYTTFLREVKKGLTINNLGTLTVEITPISLVKPRLTNVEEIGQIADYLVLMAYDFHYIYSFSTGPPAPLGGAGKTREYDIETALEEVLRVVPPEKVILGVPLYGYEWETLSDRPGSPTIPGSGAVASNRRAKELLASCDNCLQGFDEQAKQPYIIFPDNEENFFHQIYYENEKSLKEKLKLAKEKKLGGIALWALGYEGKEILKPLKNYKKSFYLNPPLGIVN